MFLPFFGMACPTCPFRVFRVKLPLVLYDSTSAPCSARIIRTPSLCSRQALLYALPIHGIDRPRSLILFMNSMHFYCLHLFFLSIQVPITSCYNPLIVLFSTLVFTLRTSRRAKAISAPLTPPSRPHPTAHTSKCAPTRARHASNHSRLCIALTVSQRHARLLKAVVVVLRHSPGRLAHSSCSS